MHSLANVRTITAHFGPKIESWLAKNQLSTPSEEQILEVVKANYDSLTLKLQVNYRVTIQVAPNVDIKTNVAF